jgi:hypothetical protein
MTMFGFDRPEDGSEERFHDRVRNWENGVPTAIPVSAPKESPSRRLPLAQHYAWWLVHNLIAHPMIGVAPVKVSFRFHDWTSRKLNGL